MVGIGFLLAAPPGGPGPINTAIQLTTFDVPLSPATGDQWWLNLFGGSAAPAAAAKPTTNALLSANVSIFGGHCGLVCNGASGTAANPNGQSGGLLFGTGGSGYNSTTAGVAGGNGGSGGLFGGNGGDGGSGGAGASQRRRRR